MVDQGSTLSRICWSWIRRSGPAAPRSRRCCASSRPCRDPAGARTREPPGLEIQKSFLYLHVLKVILVGKLTCDPDFASRPGGGRPGFVRDQGQLAEVAALLDARHLIKWIRCDRGQFIAQKRSAGPQVSNRIVTAMGLLRLLFAGESAYVEYESDVIIPHHSTFLTLLFSR